MRKDACAPEWRSTNEPKDQNQLPPFRPTARQGRRPNGCQLVTTCTRRRGLLSPESGDWQVCAIFGAYLSRGEGSLVSLFCPPITIRIIRSNNWRCYRRCSLIGELNFVAMIMAAWLELFLTNDDRNWVWKLGKFEPRRVHQDNLFHCRWERHVGTYLSRFRHETWLSRTWKVSEYPWQFRENPFE